VHLATRNWLRKEEALAQLAERAIVRLEEVFPDEDYKNRSVWRTYLPYVRYALESDLVDKDGKKRLALMWRHGNCLYSDGRWNEAEESFSQILETEMRELGADHPSTLTSMANLASTYKNQGRWDAAEELEVRVIETRKKRLGADHPDTLTSMNNLAFTLKGTGRETQAIRLMEECVQSRKRILGVEHPHTLGIILHGLS
jgi:tetratricopeptide (TPR) repeat protein